MSGRKKTHHTSISFFAGPFEQSLQEWLPHRSGSLRVTRNRFFSGPAIGAVAIAVLAIPALSLADADSERTELARLIHEIEQLERVIEEAESAADSVQRVHFQYPWLRTDLARVKAGIREYLESVPLTPRVITPLAGDYIR
jgi:RAQPRD family integrative conjugative element protein